MKATQKKKPTHRGVRPPELLRRLIDAAMEYERRTMQIYCRFESLFPKPDEVRNFWFEMAQHESRHFGALALVKGLLDSAPDRTLPAAPNLTRDRVLHLRDLLDRFHAEAKPGIGLERAFEIALEIESSEIEDLVLDLLTALKGELERERAVQSLIHDLGDLSYMIEKYTKNRALLARVDDLIENELSRLRNKTAGRRPRLRPVRR
jgi:hypothetical protein